MCFSPEPLVICGQSIPFKVRHRAPDCLVAALNQAGVPCGLVNDIAATAKDPQFAERGIFPYSLERHGESW